MTAPQAVVPVALAGRAYDIHIGAGLLERAGELLAPILPLPRVIIVTDENLMGTAHPARLEASLTRQSIEVTTIVVPPGETTKSMRHLEQLIEDMLALGIERKITVVALGGGVVGDLAGFAAAILLRGVGFVQIPTTVLAQVDSSVGGKTGINSRHGKNLIGAFYQPALVLADTDVLVDLPERELRAGYAELVKHALIRDASLFEWLEAHRARILSSHSDVLPEAIQRSVAIKAAIVAEDERETLGTRALLNFGHTFAHAYEAVAGYGNQLLHGEAVALGMMRAFELSLRLGLCPAADASRAHAHLAAVGLPTRARQVRNSTFPSEAMLAAMQRDKKVEAGSITFVLTHGIGSATLHRNVPLEEVRAVLEGDALTRRASQFCVSRTLCLCRRRSQHTPPAKQRRTLDHSAMLGSMISVAIIAGAIFVLLLLSALLSGSETAMTGVSRERVHHLANEGNRRARTARVLIEDRERLIGALLIGNNIVNILAAALATGLFIRLTGDAGVAYATVVMTILVVIFGEVLPKTYAIRNAERMALAVAPALRLLVAFLSPLSATLRLIVNSVLRLFGTRLEGGSLVPVSERLRGAIAVYHAEGAMKKLERDMLGAILDLQEVEVAEIMTHRSEATMIDVEMPLDEMVRFVRSQPYTRYPVWKDDPDQIVGVLHAKDLLSLTLDGSEMQQSHAVEKLLSPPWFIPDTTSLYQQLLAFRAQRQHLALVVDEYGTFMGVVTLEDIIEEIVGDIADEKDVEVSGIEAPGDGSAIVDGRVAIRDVNRHFDWRLPDEEAATIAGLVMHNARRIPLEGEDVIVEGYSIQVVKRQRHHLQRLRIVPPQESAAEVDEG